MTVTATKTKVPPAPKWDLESIFPGGSKSEQFKKYRSDLKHKIDSAAALGKSLPDTISGSSRDDYAKFAGMIQDLYDEIELVISFSNCLSSQDVSDNAADAIYSEGLGYVSEWYKLRARLESLSLNQSDQQWQMLTSHPSLKDTRFYLDELRTIAKSKMPIELENLALELAVNGYHAWNQLYDKMAAELTVDFEEDGKTSQLSLGQLHTKMGSPDRELRRQAFEKMTEAWKTRQELAGMTLNNQAGFRLSLYKNRGWDSPVYEPLVMARMQKNTLDTMWNVIEKNIKRLKPYIDTKKRLLNIDKFRWYDEFAPVGETERLFSFDEAGEFIVDNLKDFSRDLADFCKMALDRNWIEAEDRPGKRGGGYCTGMGPKQQSRIFMTYAGTYENLLTLAHELGHAYHSWVLNEKPVFAQIYPMNLAETASIFTESFVTNCALEQVDDKQEKLMLLDQKLQSAYVLFCDVYSRYLFDYQFYKERREGVVGTERLSQMMVESQKRAFAGLLDESGYHPLFWASKLHFFITEAPFYNFPYTFGYLFATGVYQQAKSEGSAFADKYRALLMDTGSMTTEAVAKKHLNADLSREEFWQEAVDNALSDVDEFVELADSM